MLAPRTAKAKTAFQPTRPGVPPGHRSGSPGPAAGLAGLRGAIGNQAFQHALAPAAAEPRPPAGVQEVLRGPGQALDAATRAWFEPRLGRDLGGVRLHADPAAGRSAQALRAEAYTVGERIAFAPGRLAPGTGEGRRLLAHELAHVARHSDGVLRRQPAPDSVGERAAAIAEARATASVTTEQIEAQSDAEDALKLDWRRHGDKRYAWAHGRKDNARLAKVLDLPVKLRDEIGVKARFFIGEARAAYIRTIAAALAEFPYGQMGDLLEMPGTKPGEPPGIGNDRLCDLSRKEFLLQDEGLPATARCVDVAKDPDFAARYFDRNIRAAVGYAVGGTTWDNAAYNRFKIMVVHYRNGAIDYLVLDEIGNFHTGNGAAITLDHSYVKRDNGLIYPVYRGEIYFRDWLTPNILAYKNGLKYQAAELQELYTLLQVAGAHASILAAYGAVAGSFKTSIEAFRRYGGVKLPGRPLTGSPLTGRGTPSAVPEPILDEAPTRPLTAASQAASEGEIVGGFRVIGTKELKGTTFERTITGLYNTQGRQSDIRPVMQLARSFIEEARAAGATELRIRGEFIANRNVLGIERMAQLFGGTNRQIDPVTTEIVIPIR